MNVKALVLRGRWEFAMETIPEPVPSPDDTLVAPLLVGVCGSDLHIADGMHPRVRLPVALGHEIVGRALDGPWQGQLVAIDPVEGCEHCARCEQGTEQLCSRMGVVGVDRHGGLAEKLAIRTSHVFPVPTGLSTELAALAEPLAVAVHAVQRAGTGPGDAAVVIGGGPIGLLVALSLRDVGVGQLVVVEPSPDRRRFLDSLGLTTLASIDPPQALRDLLPADGADVVFDAAAAQVLWPAVTRLLRPGGTLLLIGIYGTPAAVDLPDLAYRELSVIGTRACVGADVAAALALLERRRPDFLPLTEDITDPQGTGAALGRLRSGQSMKVLINCAAGFG
jgi:threonine dehydrogenase-like Zn-dependent dehydrogenase